MNVSIHPVANPLLMYKLFGSVYELGSHNKSRKYDLELENYWVNNCGWLRLSTKVDMGMNISNLWKPFCCGFNRDHYENFIGIRYFS